MGGTIYIIQENGVTVEMYTYNRYDAVDFTKPYYKVEVKTEGGFPALNKIWTRGDVFNVQQDSDAYKATQDSNGDSWLDDKNSTSYDVTLIDPDKDSKPKEGVSLSASSLSEADADIKSLSVEDAKMVETPTRRGRPKTNKE